MNVEIRDDRLGETARGAVTIPLAGVDADGLMHPSVWDRATWAAYMLACVVHMRGDKVTIPLDVINAVSPAVLNSYDFKVERAVDGREIHITLERRPGAPVAQSEAQRVAALVRHMQGGTP